MFINYMEFSNWLLILIITILMVIIFNKKVSEINF